MKKNVVALLLAVVMASGSVGTVPALAAETTAQEAVAIEEEIAEEATEIPEDSDFVEDSETAAEETVDVEKGTVNSEELPSETEEAVTDEIAEDMSTGEATKEIEAEPEQDLAESFEKTEEAETIKDEEPAVTEEEAVESDAKEAALAEGDEVVDSGICGENVTWTLTGTEPNLTLTISGNGEMSDFSYSASTTNAPWDSKKENIKTVIIEDGVTSIGECAFYCFISLTSVTIPNSVISIGNNAFFRCSSLSNVTLPDSISSLGEDTFYNCISLTSISIPRSVTIIEYETFGECTSLKSVDLHSGITDIMYAAFSGCSNLNTISLPNSLKTIAYKAFSGCGSLTDISIPKDVYSIGIGAFSACRSLSTIWFNGDLPELPNYADVFWNVTATAYYPYTWDYVPSSTEYGGTITWIAWDPETGIVLGEEDVRDGYVLKSVSNETDGMRISIDSILESPETCPDGFYLLKKEENGTFNKIQEYRFDDQLSPNSFGGAEYLDTDVEFGKQYTYALQAFKGGAVGKCGTEVTVRRVWRAEINEVYGCDWNRFPIYQTSNKDVKIQIYFAQNGLPSYYLDTDMFKGTMKLTCLGKVVLSSGYGEVIYRDKTDGINGHYLEWTIEKEKLNKADLPANTNCTLSVYDNNGEIIAEQQLKTSFERLSFCNTSNDDILAQDPGSIINKDKHVSKELLTDFFGKSKAEWLLSKFKEPIGDNGLCFGMAVTTDQFQAGLLSSENLFSQDKLDLVDKEDSLNSSGQSEKMLDLVKRQQLYQFVVPFIIELENHNYDFSGLLDQIDAYNNGQSALMPVIWMEAYEGEFVGDYHAVLAYRYKRNPDDGVTIYVYDPGDPYRTINSVELYIKITDLSSNPRWDYSGLPYAGNKNDGISHNTRFSWVIPDWDIYSSAIKDEHIMADISGDAFDEDIDKIKKLYPDLDIKVLNYGQAAGNPLVLIGGEGLIDLSGICSSISLAGNNCSYEVSGAQSLILDLGTTDSGNASEYGIRSITVGGDSETTVSRTTVTDDGVITYKKTLDDTTDTIVLESNSTIESPSEVSGKFDSGAEWYFDGETMTISGEGATPDYASFRDTPWYSFRNEIIRVVIEEGVTRIGNGAFCSTKSILRIEGDPKGVDSITSVQFPGSLQEIGDSAFENCNQIQEIILPDSMSGAIGKAAFHHCYSLRTLDLGTGVSRIGEAAFKGCNKIENLVIPASVEEIAKGYGMDSDTATMLAKTIPDTGAFADCTLLQEVTYESDADIEDFTFAYCDSLRSFKVTGEPVGIGRMAFYDSGSLSELTLPVTITSIGESAIERSADVLTVYYGGTEEQWRAITIDEGNDALNSAKIIWQLKKLTATVTLSRTSFTYDGKAQKPAVTVKDGVVTLVNGTDYTVSYKNNINAGTATVTITGVGDYTGSVDKTFTINKAAQSITATSSLATVSVGKTATVSTTGAKGAVTYSSSDATVATVDSKTGVVTGKKVGTVTITAQSAATANYSAASKAVTIKVVPAATTSLSAANLATGIKLTWKKVAGANGYIIYRNGSKIKTITSGSTVTYSDKKANTNGTKYTYRVVAKATTGTSTLSKSLTTYRVARTAISSLASRSAGKMTVKWKRNSKAKGYQVQYSKSKKFSSGNKTATITKNTLINKTIGSLTKGKKYYVRVRCFKTVSGKKYYSAWSAVKAVTVKK